jgi:chaperonin GroEL (HSP60 family)
MPLQNNNQGKLGPRDIEALIANERYIGKDAVRGNIVAALAVAETLKTTLGPRGLDKMLMVEGGEVAITDSGGTILKLIDLVHPAAKMMQSLGLTMGERYGDGATSSVVFAGELLKRALNLMELGLHPITIINGYRMALEETLKVMQKLSRKVTPGIIKDVGITIFKGRLGERDAEFMAQVVASALDFAGGDKDNVYVNYRPGGKLRDTTLYEGIYIDLGKRVHPAMPKKVEHARILLIDTEFDVRKVENAKYEIGDPRRMREFMEYKRKVLRVAVEMIARSGANVVFCQKNIADVAMYYMAMKGILGVRDVEKKVMHLLERATGAQIVSHVKEVTPEVLGYAGYVEEDKIGLEEIMYVRKCKNPGVASILVRGGNEKFVLELKRQIEDLIDVFAALREHGRVVPGGGAVEGEAAKRLRRFARSVESKEQLAVEAFANALEELPRAIAANAGMDATYAVLKIREWHHRGKKGYGVDAMRRGMGDAYVKAILDSYEVRRNALSSAVEVACSILRIDDVLIKRKKKSKPKKPEPVDSPIRKDGKIDLRYAFKGLR